METGDDNFQVFKTWVNEKNAASFQHTGNLQKQLQAIDKEGEVHVTMKTTEFFTDGNYAKYKDQGYNPDASFTVEEESPDGTEIQGYEFFINGNTKAPASVGIVGPAGSGKTTAMRRHIQVHTGNFHVVLCTSFVKTALWKKSKLYDFLFPDKSHSNGFHLHDGFDWMRKNPKSVTFHIDAIDTLPFASGLSDDFSLSDETLNTNKLYEPQEIVSSIMAGKLFQGCKVLCSSREHGFISLPRGLRPDRMVSLAGLSDASIHQYAKLSLGNEAGEKFCKRIENRIPGLWVVLATPVFLLFTLIGYKQDPNKLPSTRCGVLIHLLKNLIESEHGPNRTKKLEVLRKLKELAFNGIMGNKVTFDGEDLKAVDLNAEQATSFSIFLPWKRDHQSPLELSRNLLFFCHQCIQELFCALKVIEKSESDFEEFLYTKLSNTRLSVVRRFIAGVLMDLEMCEIAVKHGLLADSTLLEKRRLLSTYLEKELGNPNRDKHEFLDLIGTLSDCGSFVKESVKTAMGAVDVSSLKLKPSHLYAIGSVLRYCESLNEFDVSDCDLNGQTMLAFYQGLTVEESTTAVAKVEIGKLRMKCNPQLGEMGIEFLAKCLRYLKPDKLALDSSKISAGQLRKFREVLKTERIEIQKLHMKEVSGMGIKATSDIIAELCQLFCHCVRSINIFGWRLTEQHEATIKEKLDDIPSVNDSTLKVTIGHTLRTKKHFVPDRFEDYVRKLLEGDDFIMTTMTDFCRNRDGLNLSKAVISDIEFDYKGRAYQERLAYFEKWRELHSKFHGSYPPFEAVTITLHYR